MHPDAVHQMVHTCKKMAINTQKYPVCHTLLCVFGSALTPRAFNHFINCKNSKVHDSMCMCMLTQKWNRVNLSLCMWLLALISGNELLGFVRWICMWGGMPYSRLSSFPMWIWTMSWLPRPTDTSIMLSIGRTSTMFSEGGASSVDSTVSIRILSTTVAPPNWDSADTWLLSLQS